MCVKYKRKYSSVRVGTGDGGLRTTCKLIGRVHNWRATRSLCLASFRRNTTLSVIVHFTNLLILKLIVQVFHVGIILVNIHKLLLLYILCCIYCYKYGGIGHAMEEYSWWWCYEILSSVWLHFLIMKLWIIYTVLNWIG